MKKILAFVLTAVCALSLAACASSGSKGMSYDEFVAAKDGDAVTLEVYVQATESWWDNKITVYAADKNGGYFLYEMPCSEEDAAKLTAGTKILVEGGNKTTWSGQVEVTWDETFTGKAFTVAGKDSYVAKAAEIQAADFGKHLNQKVLVKGLEVVASKDADGNELPFMYKWDNSGTAHSDDVYFTVSDGTKTYSFNVRKYLCGPDTDVYKAAESLSIGDKIDVEMFVYWYGDDAQPRVTAISK